MQVATDMGLIIDNKAFSLRFCLHLPIQDIFRWDNWYNRYLIYFYLSSISSNLFFSHTSSNGLKLFVLTSSGWKVQVAGAMLWLCQGVATSLKNFTFYDSYLNSSDSTFYGVILYDPPEKVQRLRTMTSTSPDHDRGIFFP